MNRQLPVQFGDCAGCADLYPSTEVPAEVPAEASGTGLPVPELPPMPECSCPPCPAVPPDRKLLWLAVGFAVGYFMND